MIDEFTYPERVQQALDFVEQATAEERHKEIERQRRVSRRHVARSVRDWERETQNLAQRINAKDAERRRKQIEAQHAKRQRRTTPPSA